MKRAFTCVGIQNSKIVSGQFLSFVLLAFFTVSVLQAQVQYDDQYYDGSSQDNYSQYNTGLPGDDFSLEGALELFRQSSSPESFEQALNDERNNVNNLDLNRDGYTDYIRIIDRMNGSIHAVIIQAVLSKYEAQDIAVIEIERRNQEEVAIQIVGDEDIYGENVILEPRRPEYNDNWYGFNNQYRYRGDYYASRYNQYNYYNAWDWPMIQFIYRPVYVAYVSPWAWHVHPTWYHRWRPCGWNVFYSRSNHYHQHVHIITTPVIVHARPYYNQYRSHAPMVARDHGSKVERYRSERNQHQVKSDQFRIYERSSDRNGIAASQKPSRELDRNATRDLDPARSGQKGNVRDQRKDYKNDVERPNKDRVNEPNTKVPSERKVDRNSQRTPGKEGNQGGVNTTRRIEQNQDRRSANNEGVRSNRPAASERNARDQRPSNPSTISSPKMKKDRGSDKSSSANNGFKGQSRNATQSAPVQKNRNERQIEKGNSNDKQSRPSSGRSSH